MTPAGPVLAAAALVTAPAAAQQVSATGVWTVTGVRNLPDMAITALVDDDPAYLGAELTIGRDAINWVTDATNGQGTFDACAAPRFAPGTAQTVLCADGPWGPTLRCARSASESWSLPGMTATC